MAKLVKASINVSRISKDRLIEGKSGKYLDIMISLNDSEDQYGNTVSIWEDQTEEERRNKENRNFIGNGRVVWENDPPRVSEHDRRKANGYQPDDDEIPF